jgi:tetratricopeptide (TPR) repeat protein
MRYRGKALAGLGQHKEAFACFDAALETDQRHARAAKVKDDLIGMSAAAAATGDVTRARACAERAAKISTASLPKDRE